MIVKKNVLYSYDVRHLFLSQKFLPEKAQIVPIVYVLT